MNEETNETTEIWLSVLKDLDTELRKLEDDVRQLAMTPHAYTAYQHDQSLRGPAGYPQCPYAEYSNAGLIVLINQRLQKISEEKAIFHSLKRFAEPSIFAIAEKIRSNGFAMLAERVKDIEHARS